MSHKKTMLKKSLAKSCAVLAAMIVAAGSARGGYDDDWAYKASLSFSGYAGGETLTNFPALVNLASFPGFAYSQVAAAAGGDLRFVDATGTEINFEIEAWNPSGDTFVWVQIPVLTNSAQITAYWGNAAATLPTYTADGSTWSNGYVAVYHLSETSGTCGDSSPQSNTLTPYGNTALGAAGKVGLSPRLPDGNNDWLVAPDHGSLEGMGQLTLEAWMYDEQNDALARAILSKRTGSNSQISFYLFKYTNRNIWFYLGNSGGTAGVGGEFSNTTTDANRWYHVAATYDKNLASDQMKVFLDGVYKSAKSGASGNVTATTSALRLGILNADYGNAWKGKLDEVRIANVARSAAWLAATHKTIADNAGFAAYGAMETTDLTTPVFAGDPEIALSGDGAAFVVSAELASGEADLFAVFGPEEPFAYTNLLALGVTPGVVVSNTLSGLPADRMLRFGVLATNANGHAVLRPSSTPFMSGEVAIAGAADAFEAQFVHGAFTLTRPGTATNLPLTVAYSASGSAAAGTNYVALPVSAVFPVGAASVQIDVTPLLDMGNTADTTLTLTLEPGLYFPGENAEDSITIQNWDPPADTNVWIGGGNASNPANWSQGLPEAGDDILLGAFSTAAMTWDAGVNGLPDTVASWTQTDDYTGTVTFPIKYPTFAGAVFTNFTVTGSATVNGGFWTHPQSLTSTSGSAQTPAQLKANQEYRLCISVGTNLTVGTSGKIDASGKGYFHNAGINIYPSHGGRFNNTSSVASYGDPKFPQDVGFAFNNGTDSASKRAAGGGAILLSVGGTATVNGSITVDGGINSLAVGAGGSLILKATTVTGTGSLLSEGLAATGTTSTSGVGGRIAVITTTPVDMSSLTISASVVGRDGCGGCGTIYLKDASMTQGVLIVRDLRNTASVNAIAMCTPVIAEGDWSFDRMVLGGMVRLTVPVGTTLSLPNGLASVSSTDATLRDSILYQGGTLNIGSPATHIVQSNWVFSATSPVAINGNMLVRNGGALGLAYLAQTMSPAAAKTMTLHINGGLEVAATGSIIGTEGGAMIDSNLLPTGFGIASHGGRYQANSTTYDSILNPVYPGLGQYNSYGWMRAGAAINLTVTGELKLDGIAQSDGWNAAGGGPHGSAGTLNFTLGSLSGNGSISAKGTTANGGGRIAIRLTDPGTTFDAFGVADITAHGPASSGSAGTIYLETPADGANAGRIIVKNNDSASTVMTPIPANGMMADDPATLINASLSVESKAGIDLSANLMLASVALAANTKCELNGFDLVTRGMSVGGVYVPAGTYAAGSSLFTQGYITDVSAGQTGSVTVIGAGTVIVIK